MRHYFLPNFSLVCSSVTGSLPCSCCCWHPYFCRCFLFVVSPTVTGVHDLALFHDVAYIHAVAGVSSVVGPTVTGVHALFFTHDLAGTHVLACVSAVVGSSVAGVVAL